MRFHDPGLWRSLWPAKAGWVSDPVWYLAENGNIPDFLCTGSKTWKKRSQSWNGISLCRNQEKNPTSIVKAVKKGKLCSRLQSRYQIRKVKKLYRIRYFHYLNPYAVNQSAIRKQLLHIHFLSAEVGVMLKYGIRSVEDAEAVYQELRLENRQSGKSGLGSEELAVRQKYQALRKQVEKKTMDDHQMEMILDQMEELERQYPGGLLMAQERETKENPDVKVLRRMVRKERKEQEAALEMQKKGAACPRKNQNQERIR